MENSSEALRQCIVTRDRLNVNELLRFVLDPENSVVPDLKRKLPGRGVWVTANADKVRVATKKHLFKKAFRQSVKVADDLAEQIETLLTVSALQKLAMANKAGQLIFGFSKVDAALGKKNILALIHASAASEDSCGKLDRKWSSFRDKESKVSCIVNCFSSERLDQALGRTNVVHIALLAGGASAAFLEAVSRIESYNLVSQVNLLENGPKSDEV